MFARGWPAAAAVVLVALAGCGGDDDSDEAEAEQSATTAVADGADGVDEADVEESDALVETEATIPDVPSVNILTDFGDVCRGVKLEGATDYDPTVAGVHPVIAVSGEDPDYESSLIDLPDSWDPVTGEEATVELIACLNRTASTLVETCEGYQDDDGADTGNTVEVYDATYEVRLIAATSGEEIAATQMEATDEECPMFVFFDEGETVKPWYAEPDDELVAFLSEHVET